MAIRRDAWEKVKDSVCLNDREVHEDIDLAIHLAPFGKIKFDKSIIVSSSWRRWKKLESYFEYPYRGLKSVGKHKKVNIKNEGKQFVQKLTKYFL